MDSEETRPLTREEARERFLEAASRASPRKWVRENPIEALAAAFLAGIVAGTGELSCESRTSKALDFILRVLSE